MNKLKICLKDLRSCPGQRLHVNLYESIEGQNLETPVQGEVFLAASSASVRLSGKINSTVRLTCHHCLISFLHPLEIDLDEEFVYEDYLNDSPRKEKEKELQLEDFYETVPYAGTIDILDVVYQAIVLAIPNYCLCGPGCAGPSIYNKSDTAKSQKTRTGEAETPSSIDPRWNNLKTIFSIDTQKEKVRDNNS
jgi:uncharacterized metal-binding protein YceD (DUF177 family)